MYNSASVANRTCFTSPPESPAILFENCSQGDTAEWRNAGTKHDNLVPRVLSLPSFLEVGRERTLGTRLQTWSKMADQPKTGREEYDGVCAKVRITKVFFECENIGHFSLVSLNWKSWFCDELVWAHVRVAYCLVMSAGLMCHVTWMCAKRLF